MTSNLVLRYNKKFTLMGFLIMSISYYLINTFNRGNILVLFSSLNLRKRKTNFQPQLQHSNNNDYYYVPSIIFARDQSTRSTRLNIPQLSPPLPLPLSLFSSPSPSPPLPLPLSLSLSLSPSPSPPLPLPLSLSLSPSPSHI